ncbi:phosphoribosyl-AMP cyclohydrolase [Leuconostoc mesenteroides]
MIGTEPDFNKQSQNGLIPAVIVDAETKAFLMLGYMNKESYSLTKSTGQTWFWSRERQELWHKGKTSGNIQQVVSMTLDCDLDTLLIHVNPAGPACHTNAYSCFFNTIKGEGLADANQATITNKWTDGYFPKE